MTLDFESSALDEKEPAVITTEEIYNDTFIIEETTVEDVTVLKDDTLSTEDVNEDTSVISYNETSNEDLLIEEESILNEEFSVPENQTGFKSFEPYHIMPTSSPNYNMITSLGYVDENGLWKIGEYYCVAMGSYYSNRLGNVFEVELDSGKVFKVIIVDHKSDLHTDYTHRYTLVNNCVTEFVVDYNALNPIIKQMGSIGALDEFSGVYVKITKLFNIYD